VFVKTILLRLLILSSGKRRLFDNVFEFSNSLNFKSFIPTMPTFSIQRKILYRGFNYEIFALISNHLWIKCIQKAEDLAHSLPFCIWRCVKWLSRDLTRGECRRYLPELVFSPRYTRFICNHFCSDKNK
jgi:hypothetical protein